MCEVCSLIKFVNKRKHTVSERKINILTLISIDICEPLPLLIVRYNYFLKIINNHSQKIWTILLKHYNNVSQKLWEWWLKIELQISVKVLAVQSNNATELKATLDAWCKFFDIVSQYTVLYMSIQNDVAEYTIQTTENSVWVMIKNSELSIEFWVETVQINTYLYNHTATDSMINDKQITLKKVFISVKSFINHLWVWRCKCYFYVDLKSLLKRRQDKFMNREQVKVIVDYIEKTTKQYLLWALNMKCVIKSHTVKFTKNEKKSTVNLRLHRQTLNTLFEQKPVR